MAQFPYISPAHTPVSRMVNPTPYNTDPFQRLPDLPLWMQKKSGAHSEQDTNPHKTNAIPRPEERRVDSETSLRQTFVSETRDRDTSAVPSSPQLQLGTPPADVFDVGTESPEVISYYAPSPIPSPRLHPTEWTFAPSTRLIEPASFSSGPARRPAAPRAPDRYSPEVAPTRKAVHFRNTPSIYEVERTGWKPIPQQRRRRINNRRFRVVGVDRAPIFSESAKKLASVLLPWALWIAFVAVMVGAVARLKGSAPIVQLDLRPRIPPEFYFTHRELRKLTPKIMPAYEYLSQAGEAGMVHLDQVIRLTKDAQRQEKVDRTKKRDWHQLSQQLDLVRIRWDAVLYSVRGVEKELITQSTNWYDTKAAARSALHSPQMASLAANERRKVRDGWLEDIRSAASFSAKAIENQARFVNSSLDTAERSIDLFLPTGCGPWQNILLGPKFEDEKPGYLNRLPHLYTKFAPSWTSKWLERKRRRMQICASLVPHLAYFQDYVRIVTLSNEHVRGAARGLVELIEAADSPVSFDGMSPASVVVTSNSEVNLSVNPSASTEERAVETAEIPRQAGGVEENQNSTSPISKNYMSWVSTFSKIVESWAPEQSTHAVDSEDVRNETSPATEHVPGTDGDASAESGEQESVRTVSPVDTASLNSSLMPGAEDTADKEAPQPSPPPDGCVDAEHAVATEAEPSIQTPTSTIYDTSSRRSSHLMNAAREAEDRRGKSALPAASATIDDIFRAWDKICGGISLVIDREFRT